MPKGQEKELSKTFESPVTDNSREMRDISNILSILDSNILKTNPFGANVTGDNSYRRAERISAALHLITNHVPESEPLRLGIRRGGLSLLNLILDLRAGFRAPSSEKGQAALAAIRELISLVRLLAVSGYVSAQNVHAVAEALDELGSLIVVSQKSSLSDQMNLSREDLTPPAQQSQSLRTRTSRSTGRRTRRSVTDIKDETDRSAGGESARADQIMDILKLGGVLGIKDIASNLPQYSEKMIQRELAELVHSNRVKKVGAKRWSRYQFVS